MSFFGKFKEDKKYRFEAIVGVWSGIVALILIVAVVFVFKTFVLDSEADIADDGSGMDTTPVTAQSVTADKNQETPKPYDVAVINENDIEDEDEELKDAKVAYATTDVNVRESGDLTANVLGKLSRGQKVKILEYGKEWTKIKFNDSEGYVSSIYLSATKPVQKDTEDDSDTNTTTTTQTTTTATAKPATAKATKSPAKATKKPSTKKKVVDEDDDEDEDDTTTSNKSTATKAPATKTDTSNSSSQQQTNTDTQNQSNNQTQNSDSQNTNNQTDNSQNSNQNTNPDTKTDNGGQTTDNSKSQESGTTNQQSNANGA